MAVKVASSRTYNSLMTPQERKVLNRALCRLRTGVHKWFEFQGGQYQLTLTEDYEEDDIIGRAGAIKLHLSLKYIPGFPLFNERYIRVCEVKTNQSSDVTATPEQVYDAICLHQVYEIQEN
jgi:hypothetical protein